MLQKLRQYLIALTVVLAMAVAYQTLVTPQLHPPEVKEMHVATMPPLTRFNESIKGLFPDEDCWQRGGCTILKTVDGMLLFEEWVDLGNNKFRLSPLSIVVGGGLKNYLDLEQLRSLKFDNLEGVIAGKSFYVGNIDLKKAQKVLDGNA